MRFKRMAVLALLAALLVTPAAMAEGRLAGSHVVEGFAALHPANNTYVLRLSGEEENRYAVFDANGNRLSAAYGQIEVWQGIPYYMVTADTNSMNSRGLLDGDGREVLPPVYGRIDVAGSRWTLGCVLSDWSTIASTDVYFDGQKIGTLSADDYTMSTYTAAHGAYLGVSGGQAGFYLNSRFERVEGAGEYFVTEEYFLDWRDGAIYHPATGQRAFDASCTLTADEVERPVWYNGGAFIGLQGQVIDADRAYDNVEYFGGSYLLLRANSGAGIAGLQGTEALPALYDQLGGSTQSYFAAGYQAVMRDGKLSWLNRDGQVTAAVDYTMSEGELQGFSLNGLFATTRALDKTVVFTATAGELPQRYEDAVTVASPLQRLLCVKLGGLWGAIDMEGRVVIPFEHENPLQISHDGTVAIGQNAQRQQVVYAVSYGDEATSAAVETPAPEPAQTLAPATPAADNDGWVCPGCGQTNAADFNFCPVDGVARPDEPPACKSCGFVMPDGSVPNFCPGCGAAFR